MNKRTFIVAEIGNNHEGSFQTALKLIDKAKACKVDAVKFQTFIPELFLDISHPKFKFYKSLQLSFEEFEKLSLYAKKKKLIFFSTPLDLESAKFLKNIQSIFKIASSDINFYSLIKTVASFNKEIIISTGASTFKEIKKAHDLVSKIWKKNKYVGQLNILHCISEYPADINKINLKTIWFLMRKFPKCKIGFSDHTVGMEASTLSVTMGCEIIEKHFTLNNNFSDFRDHRISLNPKNMANLVNKIRYIESIMGTEDKRMYGSELKNLNLIRRKLFINQSIKKNETIKSKYIDFVRSNRGLKIEEIKKIIGKKVIKNEIQKGILTKNKLKMIKE